MFAGTHTALITPFGPDQRFDPEAYARLIEGQVAAGMTGIVPVGTTGESPTLDVDEHLEVIHTAVETSAGRLVITAGTGGNSTREAIELTTLAAQAGATATLQVAPYYNKPSQEGLYRHFRAIAEATELPIMLYSIPGRSVIEISVETVTRLAADCPTIRAIKEAGGRVDRVSQLRQALPEDFEILSGDDPLTLSFMACGATGLVSVAGNLIPREMVQLVSDCLNNDYAAARKRHEEIYPLLTGLMRLDTNPVPIKAALAALGQCRDEVRLPLAPLSEANRHALEQLLQAAGLQ